MAIHGTLNPATEPPIVKPLVLKDLRYMVLPVTFVACWIDVKTCRQAFGNAVENVVEAVVIRPHLIMRPEGSMV